MHFGIETNRLKSMMPCAWFLAVFVYLFVAIADAGPDRKLSTTKVPLERCKPLPGMSKQQCQKMISDGCSELLAWVGTGCVDPRGRRYKDGGCQSLADGAYCKWKCRNRCLESGLCIWVDSECRYRGCGGIDVYDDSPPDVVRTISGYSAIRTTNWALDGIGARIALPQADLCGIQLYAISSRDPNLDELSVVEMRIYSSMPQNFSEVPLLLTSLALAKSLARGRLGDSPFNWYSLRYELAEHQSFQGVSLNEVYIHFRFPQWKSHPFSFLTYSSPANQSQALNAAETPLTDQSSGMCPWSMGNSTSPSVSSCRTPDDRRRLLVKIFA